MPIYRYSMNISPENEQSRRLSAASLLHQLCVSTQCHAVDFCCGGDFGAADDPASVTRAAAGGRGGTGAESLGSALVHARAGLEGEPKKRTPGSSKPPGVPFYENLDPDNLVGSGNLLRWILVYPKSVTARLARRAASGLAWRLDYDASPSAPRGDKVVW